MSLPIDYMARETATSLWRNRALTVAAILTVTVSLSLVGSMLLLREGASRLVSQWQKNVDVIVWLDPVSPAPAAETSQQATIAHQVTDLPYIASCTYYTQAYDFKEAQVLLGSAVANEALTPSSTPASLRCKMRDPRQLQAVITQFGQGYPGVHSVSGPTAEVKSVERWIGVGQAISLVVALALAVSALVLILNTIRLGIFARRREVAVMKLVGATNWFIRVPFICEGMIQGLLGAAIAVGFVLIVHWLLDGAQANAWHIPLSNLIGTCGVVGAGGAIIGALGSYWGIRRFLTT